MLSSYLDSVRGPLLPTLSRHFNISYQETGYFLVLGNFSAIFFTLLLIPLLRHWGEKRVTILILLLLGGSGLGSFGVSTSSLLWVYGAFVGGVIAMGGAMGNILILSGSEERYRSKFFCLLHCFYGFVSLLSPLVAARVLSAGFRWHTVLGVSVVGVVFCLIYVFKKLPDGYGTFETVHSSYPPSILIPCLFAAYVAAEVGTSMWMTTYLLEHRQMNVAESAPYLSLFFLLMGFTRLLTAFCLNPLHEKSWLVGSISLWAFFFLMGHLGSPLALSFTGVIGPFFPILLSRISRNFPREWRSLAVWLLSAVQGTLAMSHFFMAALVPRLGISVAYWVPFLFMLIAVMLLFVYFRKENAGGLEKPLPTV